MIKSLMQNINYEERINLSNYTTIKVGGFAEYFSKYIQKDKRHSKSRQITNYFK